MRLALVFCRKEGFPGLLAAKYSALLLLMAPILAGSLVGNGSESPRARGDLNAEQNPEVSVQWNQFGFTRRGILGNEEPRAGVNN